MAGKRKRLLVYAGKHGEQCKGVDIPSVRANEPHSLSTETPKRSAVAKAPSKLRRTCHLLRNGGFPIGANQRKFFHS